MGMLARAAGRGAARDPEKVEDADWSPDGKELASSIKGCAAPAGVSGRQGLAESLGCR
jgi:hypothetical protein